MAVRDVVVRLLEWRARWFSDPADRLQFLRRNLHKRPSRRPGLRRALEHLPVLAITLGLVLAVGLLLTSGRRALGITATADFRPLAANQKPEAPFPAATVPRVWLVQSNPQFDLYSNGLRVENQYATSGRPRRYLVLARRDTAIGEWRTEPAGIVFHTTESHMAPFEEDQNQTLRQAGEGLLEFVQRQRAYHFVIDRFGRVFRIVRESDCANHAGNSVWADPSWIYVYLNRSFLGVAFEAQSNPPADVAPVNAAQIHAARILTEMLRSRYGIPAANCVTHAQVSVNPGNWRAGYHTDWAANLPFRELGLSDNYGEPPASVLLFGFQSDSLLAQAGGLGVTPGVAAAEAQIHAEAAARGLTPDLYRERLQRRYRDAIRALAEKGAPEEYNE